MTGRRILLAGGTGVIGRHLIPRLIAAGHDVTATTRYPERSAGIAAAGATPLVLDVLDRNAVLEHVVAARPEIIIHQLTDLTGRDFAGNSRLRIEGTRNLVDAAVAAGVRRMVAQSIAFIYAPGEAPAVETDPLDHDNAGLADTLSGVIALESAVAELPEGVILRYGILYGPGTWNSSASMTGDQLRTGERHFSGAITSFVHVDDAAQAAVDALIWPAGVVNVVDDEPAPETDWLPFFAGVIGAPPPPAGLITPSGRAISNAKARALGWNPRFSSWRDGFQEALG